MTLKNYLLTMTITTAVCWLCFNFVINKINPLTADWIGFALFYSSLALALIGSAAIVGFVIRFILLRQKLAFRAVKEAFRQSFLFAALIIISLILLSQNLFDWLNLTLLILGLSVLEFLLLGYSSNND